ncbi:hypothetical protein L5515_015636 [Caenorhabditis briggsae]|uniref:Uncharacterized protein n=1 Tax=Caenorhabditis briggsae TaxID=6238 RepID=A0AAE9EFN8_CAEBR|nr:hypothetical protein L5515_015636 [Caenorhabditis briggsae]
MKPVQTGDDCQQIRTSDRSCGRTQSNSSLENFKSCKLITLWTKNGVFAIITGCIPMGLRQRIQAITCLPLHLTQFWKSANRIVRRTATPTLPMKKWTADHEINENALLRKLVHCHATMEVYRNSKDGIKEYFATFLMKQLEPKSD